jgi:hypothetical protein
MFHGSEDENRIWGQQFLNVMCKIVHIRNKELFDEMDRLIGEFCQLPEEEDQATEPEPVPEPVPTDADLTEGDWQAFRWGFDRWGDGDLVQSQGEDIKETVSIIPRDTIDTVIDGAVTFLHDSARRRDLTQHSNFSGRIFTFVKLRDKLATKPCAMGHATLVKPNVILTATHVLALNKEELLAKIEGDRLPEGFSEQDRDNVEFVHEFCMSASEKAYILEFVSVEDDNPEISTDISLAKLQQPINLDSVALYNGEEYDSVPACSVSYLDLDDKVYTFEQFSASRELNLPLFFSETPFQKSGVSGAGVMFEEKLFGVCTKSIKHDRMIYEFVSISSYRDKIVDIMNGLSESSHE